MGNIEKIHIHEFRKFYDVDIPLGDKITAIAGKNGTMKTTLLGILGHPFSMKDSTNPLCGETTIDGSTFETDMLDKFKFSPTKDVAGHHRWDVYFDNDKLSNEKVYPVNSIIRSRENGKLRFFHATKRTKGSGFRTYPVIYLSLQRLSPLGESGKSTFDATTLTDKEKEFYNHYHNVILCTQTQFTNTGVTSASNKKSTISGETLDSDANGISAGQDNVGKILMSILSFKRLKEKHPSSYIGGLLLIDELDASLYPAAQEKMVECLYRFSSDLKLQVIFTTHSMVVLTKIKDSKYKSDTSLIYLEERGGKVINHHNPSLIDMQNHLNAVARNPQDVVKINVFCEDDVGRPFAKALLGSKLSSHVCFNKKYGSISAEHYHVFIDDGIENFVNSIVILDGDKKTKRKKNIVILPPNCKPSPTCPEKMFYHFLKNLDDTDKFWSTELGGHTKDTCFRDYPDTPTDVSQYKNWYQTQKIYWGKNCKDLYKRWMEMNVDEVERFRADFIKAYNILARSMELPEIIL